VIGPGGLLAGCATGGALFLTLGGRPTPMRVSPLFVAALAVGAMEELVWRGLVLASVASHVGVAGAVAASTTGFALSHYPTQRLRGVAVHTLTGLAFAGAFLGGGIGAAIAAHLAYNALAFAGSSPLPAAAVVEAVDVVKRYGPVEALAGVSLSLEAGEVLALLGPNGAGKTTLVSILLGLRRPNRGTVRVVGASPGSRAARLAVAATPQEMSFPPTLRVREVVAFVLAHHPDGDDADAVLARFGLAEVARRQTGALSGGQRRRLAVALAFAPRPQLAVLDEPTAGLDVESRLAVWEAVRKFATDGGTVLLTTHQLDEAEQLASRIAILSGGRIRADGTATELTASGDRSLQDAYLLLTGAAT